MLLSVEVDFLAVLMSGVIAFLLGTVWYHPKVMGARWMELRGLNIADTKAASPMPFVASFFLWMLSACFYSFLAGFLGIDTAAGYFCLSCLLWVAFAMPSGLMGALYSNSSVEAVAIDMAYQLGGYYVFALVHMAMLFIAV
jgi:hypothetical protein